MQMENFISDMSYLLSASGFFLGLKLLSSPKTARLGNAIGALAMVLAVLTTLVVTKPITLVPIAICLALGSLVGFISAQKIAMTAMPQMVSIFNGLGGLASVMVAISEADRILMLALANTSSLFVITTWFSVVVGAVTFSGSIIAFLKLQEIMSTRSILVAGQRFFSVALAVLAFVVLVMVIKGPLSLNLLYLLGLIAAILGVLVVIPIGGADMPVVISLLNSYSGVAALAAGFVVQSNILIISGALVGASGLILTRLMCQAMNRSLNNVIFGAFTKTSAALNSGEEKAIKEFQALDAAMLLANANKVIVVPGYGLAVSQAQRNLRELADALKGHGVEVLYAVHPVAGRMPGHMNVLLAEADVPYKELFDLDEVNGEFESADVAVIIGANDVVNPLARTDKTNPLYGMPILNADKARSVIVMKRGRGRGFAGVENPLFSLDNSGTVYGDAKQSIVKVLNALKEV